MVESAGTAAPGPVTMDALPDELLLMVLGRVDDALTLLEEVPLVCKRWHRLSQDPRAWRSASVLIEGCTYYENSYKGEHENHAEILNAARVLVHAPALRHVSFGWYSASPGPFSCSFDKEMMTSALARSKAQVHEIEFPQPDMLEGSGLGYPDDPLEDMSPEELSLLVDFLSRNRKHVRYLKLGHMLQAGTQFQRALGQCENLEELHLMLPDGFQYQGELRGRRLPKLNRLTLKSWYKVEHCRPFLRDLFGAVAQSVRHVRCKDLCLSSKDVLAELPRCLELRSLHCGVEGVAAVKTLTRLRSLSLRIQYADRDQQRVLSAAERGLRACAPLLDLRVLRLDGGFEYGGKWGSQHSQALAALLRTLGTKTPNVTHLSTSGMLTRQVSPETVLALLKSLPRLQSVHIDRFRFDCLPALAEVGRMKRLSGEVSYREGEGDGCRAAVEQLKRQRPDLDCKLSDHQSYY
ncbi:uncharacterized protein LOC117652821 isoform X2 [Thrips palmi]|uniref:Uncharacterized protein LOC117652821 isoform X2 n=1 Tax=Thrips palmi TaxID=161013 RepID=A0A6P9ADH0_THRPL|nr:uncharacterized protein LOC117652821 isoform X2 [Thrips palmi]